MVLLFCLEEDNCISIAFSSDLSLSLVAQMIKRLPTMQETRGQSLGREDLLEKEMATHSSILAWEKKSLEGYSPWSRKEPDVTKNQLGL